MNSMDVREAVELRIKWGLCSILSTQSEKTIKKATGLRESAHERPHDTALAPIQIVACK